MHPYTISKYIFGYKQSIIYFLYIQNIHFSALTDCYLYKRKRFLSHDS